MAQSILHLDWPRLEPPFLSILDRIRHVRAKNLVPHNEERLREVVLVAVELVVNVMVSAIILEKNMQNISGKPQPAVIVHGLDRSEREEEDGGPRSHSGDEERKSTADCIQDEPLERVIVKSSKGVGHYESVVLRMDVLV